jgi:hypothetical protein
LRSLFREDISSSPRFDICCVEIWSGRPATQCVPRRRDGRYSNHAACKCSLRFIVEVESTTIRKLQQHAIYLPCALDQTFLSYARSCLPYLVSHGRLPRVFGGYDAIFGRTIRLSFIFKRIHILEDPYHAKKMSTPQGYAIEDPDSSAKSDQDQSDSSDHSSDDGDEDRLIRDMVSPSDARTSWRLLQMLLSRKFERLAEKNWMLGLDLLFCHTGYVAI